MTTPTDPVLADLRGLLCPLPVLKARKRLADLAAGQQLQVLATDPRAPADLAELCSVAGHRLVASTQAGDVFSILIERR